MGRVREVVNADCMDAMRTMSDCTFDAVVTDPPYGLSFMGKEWDSFGTDTRQPGDEHYWVPDNPFGRASVRYGWNQDKAKLALSNAAFQDRMTPIFSEVLRVSKPGAYLLCFGGTRTFHRMACAIEDAGWEIRDCIMWVYGSGFPKSMDVGKAIDKELNAERDKVPNPLSAKQTSYHTDVYGGQDGRTFKQPIPVTEQAKEWDGWGTALKPAWEPIIVARKPLDGTVAHNVMEHGTGALNIDACRVPTDGEKLNYGTFHAGGENGLNGTSTFRIHERHYPEGYQPSGRFPANLAHDGSEEVLELFPDVGVSSGGGMHTRGTPGHESTSVYSAYTGGSQAQSIGLGDSGSAARFFYCAKASAQDRGDGNDHPTVKPNELMRWLVRLVCRKDGIVLDPFCGSGSTGVACVNEGMSFVGIDQDEHYCGIARRRIEDALPHQQRLF